MGGTLGSPPPGLADRINPLDGHRIAAETHSSRQHYPGRAASRLRALPPSAVIIVASGLQAHRSATASCPDARPAGGWRCPGRVGLTNLTDMVTLADGQRAIAQRYRRRKDAACRLRVMQGQPGRPPRPGIPAPRVRESGLDDGT